MPISLYVAQTASFQRNQDDGHKLAQFAKYINETYFTERDVSNFLKKLDGVRNTCM